MPSLSDAPRRRWPPWLPWLALALAVRGAYLLEQSAASPLFYHPLLDEQESLDAARALLAGKGFGPEPLFKAPLYSILLAGVIGLFGEGGWPWATRGLQHLLGAVAAALGCDAARRLAPPGRSRLWAGSVAGAAIALHGPLVRLESTLVLDSLAFFLQSAMLWALIRYATTPRRGKVTAQAPEPTFRPFLAAAAVLAALAWLTRPTLTLVLPALATIVAVAGNSWRRELRRAGLFLLPVALAMALVAGRNALVAGQAMIMPWQGGFNFYQANHTGAHGRYLTQSSLATGPELAASANPTRALALDGYAWAVREGRTPPPTDPARPFGAVDRWWMDRARRDIVAAPGTWLGLMGKKLLYLASDKEIFNFEEYDLQRELSPVLRFLAPGRFGLLLPFALAALAFPVPPRRRWGFTFVLTYAGVLAPAIALYYASGRLRMPLVFPAALLTGHALGALAGARSPWAGRHPSRRSAAAALFVLGVFLAWVDWFGVRSERMHHADLARLSNAAYRAGRWPQALAFADRAEAERPGYPPLPLRRGQALYALGRRDEAAAAFREGARRQPTDPQAPYNLGVVLHYDQSNPRAALIEGYGTALARDPSHAPARARAAVAHATLGETTAARALLQAGPLPEALRREAEAALLTPSAPSP